MFTYFFTGIYDMHSTTINAIAMLTDDSSSFIRCLSMLYGHLPGLSPDTYKLMEKMAGKLYFQPTICLRRKEGIQKKNHMPKFAHQGISFRIKYVTVRRQSGDGTKFSSSPCNLP